MKTPGRIWLAIGRDSNLRASHVHYSEPCRADAEMYARHGATVVRYTPERYCADCARYRPRTPAHGECPLRVDAPSPYGHCESWEAKP